MIDVLVVGDPDDVALVATPGEYAWGTLHVDDAEAPDLVVALDETPVVQADAPLLRWSSQAIFATDDAPWIAPAGDGLWSRAPWPAADALFDLEPARPESVLLVGAPDTTLDKLAACDVAVTATARLTAADLVLHGTVAFAGDASAPPPVGYFAALAARRLVIAPAMTPSFGCIAGVDHLDHHHEDELVVQLESCVRHPFAWDHQHAFAALAAEAHRGSAVIGRLAADRLRALRRSAAPRG